ncbi:hypothetical protein [Acinetobacter phage vB_AbM_WUPSU]|nr:hypothetical protein [Acinetobacter phage vB_AbM_WUPSU]
MARAATIRTLPINYTPNHFWLGGLNGSLGASNLDMTATKVWQLREVNSTQQ